MSSVPPLVASFSFRSLSGLSSALSANLPASPEAAVVQSPIEYQISLHPFPDSNFSIPPIVSAPFPLSVSSSLDFTARVEISLADGALNQLCRNKWKINIIQKLIQPEARARWLENFNRQLVASSAAPPTSALNSPTGKGRIASAEKKPIKKTNAPPSAPAVVESSSLLAAMLTNEFFPDNCLASLAFDASALLENSSDLPAFHTEIPLSSLNTIGRQKNIQFSLAIAAELERAKNFSSSTSNKEKSKKSGDSGKSGDSSFSLDNELERLNENFPISSSTESSGGIFLDYSVRLLSKFFSSSGRPFPFFLNFPEISLKNLPTAWLEDWDKFSALQTKARAALKSFDSNSAGGGKSLKSSEKGKTPANKKNADALEAKEGEIKILKQWAEAKYEISLEASVPAILERVLGQKSQAALEALVVQQIVRGETESFQEPEYIPEPVEAAVENDSTTLSVPVPDSPLPGAPSPSRAGQKKRKEDDAGKARAAVQAAEESAAQQRAQSWKRAHRTVHFPSLSPSKSFLSRILVDFWLSSDKPRLVHLTASRRIRFPAGGDFTIAPDQSGKFSCSVDVSPLLKPGVSTFSLAIPLEFRPSTTAAEPPASQPNEGNSNTLNVRPGSTSSNSTRPTTPSKKEKEKEISLVASLPALTEFFSSSDFSSTKEFLMNLALKVSPSPLVPFEPAALAFPWTLLTPRVPLLRTPASPEEKLVENLHSIIKALALGWKKRKIQYERKARETALADTGDRTESSEESEDVSETRFLLEDYHQFQFSEEFQSFHEEFSSVVLSYHRATVVTEGGRVPDLSSDDIAASSLFSRVWDLFQFTLKNPKVPEEGLQLLTSGSGDFEPQPRVRIAGLPSILRSDAAGERLSELLVTSLLQDSADFPAVRQRLLEISAERALSGDFSQACEILQWRCWIERPGPENPDEKSAIAQCWQEFAAFLMKHRASSAAIEALQQGLRVSPYEKNICLDLSVILLNEALKGRQSDRLLPVCLFTLLSWSDYAEPRESSRLEASVIILLNWLYWGSGAIENPIDLKFEAPEKSAQKLQKLKENCSKIFDNEWTEASGPSEDFLSERGAVDRLQQFFADRQCFQLFAQLRSFVESRRPSENSLCPSSRRASLFSGRRFLYEDNFPEAENFLLRYLGMPKGAKLFQEATENSPLTVSEEFCGFFDPAMLDGCLELAQAFLDRNLESEALALFEFARSWQPKQPEFDTPALFYRLITIYRHQGRTATPDFHSLCVEFLAASPSSLALIELAQSFLEFGDFQQSEALLSQANMLDRTNSAVWLLLSFINLNTGDFSLATQALDQAKRISGGAQASPEDSNEQIMAKISELSLTSILDAPPPSLSSDSLFDSRISLWLLVQKKLRSLGRETAASQLNRFIK